MWAGGTRCWNVWEREESLHIYVLVHSLRGSWVAWECMVVGLKNDRAKQQERHSTVIGRHCS